LPADFRPERKHSFVKGASFTIAVGLLAVIAGVGVARDMNRVALERAYAIMDDAKSLKVNVASLNDVLSYVKKYQGEARSSKPTGDCQPSDCMSEINVYPSFYMGHTWLIPLIKRAGVQVFEFNVTLWVEDGTLTAVEETFLVPRAVGADVHVTSMTSNPAERNCRSLSYQLHPGFITSYQERYGTPEFTYWINGRKLQEAPPPPRMNLDCVTTMSGCQSVAQILPSAWTQHQVDLPKIEALQKTMAAANASETSCR
jgi:hypothetical protein